MSFVLLGATVAFIVSLYIGHIYYRRKVPNQFPASRDPPTSTRWVMALMRSIDPIVTKYINAITTGLP